MEAILVACITAVAGIIVAYMQYNNKLRIQYDEQRITNLETKWESLADDVQKISVSMAEIATELKFLRKDN